EAAEKADHGPRHPEPYQRPAIRLGRGTADARLAASARRSAELCNDAARVRAGKQVSILERRHQCPARRFPRQRRLQLRGLQEGRGRGIREEGTVNSRVHGQVLQDGENPRALWYNAISAKRLSIPQRSATVLKR